MESVVLLKNSSLLRRPDRSIPSSVISSRRLTLTIERRWRRFSPPPSRCNKMFVPGFGEMSPEAKAAQNLQDFFTFLALRIVLAQLENYNPEAYGELMGFVERNPMKDGDDFCRRLMRESPRHKDLALRILEVRSAYSKRDFEWENLRKLAFRMVDDSNTKLMREYIQETSHFENGK